MFINSVNPQLESCANKMIYEVRRNSSREMRQRVRREDSLLEVPMRMKSPVGAFFLASNPAEFSDGHPDEAQTQQGEERAKPPAKVAFAETIERPFADPVADGAGQNHSGHQRHITPDRKAEESERHQFGDVRDRHERAEGSDLGVPIGCIAGHPWREEGPGRAHEHAKTGCA